MRDVTLRLRRRGQEFTGEVLASADEAEASFHRAERGAGSHLLLGGDRPYHVMLSADPSQADGKKIVDAIGTRVLLKFGAGRALRRRLQAVGGTGLRPTPAAVNLTSTFYKAVSLYLRADGTISRSSDGPAPSGLDALDAIVAAARWVSSRRTTTFTCLFPPSPFHPDEDESDERLSLEQAAGLHAQLAAIATFVAASSEIAAQHPIDAAQLRSAVITVLSHIVATARDDAAFTPMSHTAAQTILDLIDGETGAHARPELRAHAIHLMSMRAPHVSEVQQQRVRELLAGLRRNAPPYEQLKGRPWRFAVCSAYDFHEGEYEVLRDKYDFSEIEVPEGTPKPSAFYSRGYRALQAPFQTPDGHPIEVLMRVSSPQKENWEMSQDFYIGLAISRHANLGAGDMQAASLDVQQSGYKLMLNAQCAGLTTRFAIARMFPQADIYSSWDSTYFRTNSSEKIVSSEGMDCFHAVLQGMAAGETFVEIDERIKKAQWYHRQSQIEGFVQFVGPANPHVIARYEDVNHDGKADYYDGFLDLKLVEIHEKVRGGSEPRAPGVAASQISGAAARGLGWAAGSMNRVTQYSELWDELPGESERFYAFTGAGFFSPSQPPADVRTGEGPVVELGRLPAVVRYLDDPSVPGGIKAEVLFNAYLSHTPQELKRLLIAAEAYWRALDLGLLGAEAPLDTPLGRRAGLLITLAGLLEYPADQNQLGTLWEQALAMLNFPPISRTLVRKCNTDEDHHQGNYYGSRRGIRQLIGEDGNPGDLQTRDPRAFELLSSDDATIGRAKMLDIEGLQDDEGE